jgi:hypothetical protein
MSLNLKNAKKGMSGPLAPIGNHIARCYQIIDLGTQDSIKYGNASHKLRFTWELCEEKHDFGKGKPEPYSVSMTVNFFFGRNSNFTKLLEGWKGGTFTDAELDAFELKKLVGKSCMVNVVHNTSGDNDYANVASVSPVPAKWKDRVPAIYNKTLYFETEMGPNSDEFKSLPEFLQKMIEKCHEWQGKGSSLPPKEEENDPFGEEDEETKAINAETQAIQKRIQPEDDSDDIAF